MGRHGGGSRSGGRSGGGSRSRSGSRSGGRSSNVRSSSKPFKGCYNRSYYHRGRYYPYYTTDASFGTKNGGTIAKLFIALFITLHMTMMLSAFGSTLIHVGGKVNGNVDRIGVADQIGILTAEEENDILELFNDVYDITGMPITLITDDCDWIDYYVDIETYSEELYYSIGFDESSMVILFTQDDTGDFTDWVYDMYCGDDTIKCLSDDAFETLLDNFHKAMAKQDLPYALDYAWNSVMNQLAKTTINWSEIPILIIILCFYSIFYVTLFGADRKRRHAAKYFKENPDALDNQPMTLYNECPNCGAQNTTMSETCLYCGTVLKISDGNVTLVSPK